MRHAIRCGALAGILLLMTQRYRLLAVDMDGTLLDRRSQVDPVTVRAVRAAVTAGVHVVLASGRAPRHMLEVHRQLRLETPIVAHNGALVYDVGGQEVIHHEPIDLEVARRIAQMLKEHDPAINLHLETQEGVADRWNVETLDERILDSITRWKVEPPHSVGEIRRLLGDEATRVSKLWFYAPSDVMAAIKRRMTAEMRDRIATLAFDDVTLTILSSGVSKASAVEWVAARFGVSQPEVIAIGDDLNDVPMLGWAGLGVAMANAKPAAWAVARATTGSNDEHGVAQAIRRWVLRPTGSPPAVPIGTTRRLHQESAG
jgi:Cof subfamily protein (haloacid dehalogenase superfamily)